MTISTFDNIKIKMDGQEHEINGVEVNRETREIYFDLENTFAIQIDNADKLFDKELEFKQIGFDDEFTKAKIDSFYVDEKSRDNRILSLSF